MPDSVGILLLFPAGKTRTLLATYKRALLISSYGSISLSRCKAFVIMPNSFHSLKIHQMAIDTQRLQKLIDQRKVIDARIRKAKALDSKRQRQALTKIKILIGAYILNTFEYGEIDKIKTFKEKIEPFLTRENEKQFMADYLDNLIEKRTHQQK